MFRRFGFLIGYLSDTRTRSLTAVAICFLVFAAIEFVVDHALRTRRLSPLQDSVLDATIIGMLFSLIFWLLLAGNRERRRRVREDLERVAELNHEIRNALQVITHTQYANKDFEHRKAILDSVARIDDVLRRALKISGKR